MGHHETSVTNKMLAFFRSVGVVQRTTDFAAWAKSNEQNPDLLNSLLGKEDIETADLASLFPEKALYIAMKEIVKEEAEKNDLEVV
jgi:hypothetical protein